MKKISKRVDEFYYLEVNNELKIKEKSYKKKIENRFCDYRLYEQ